MLTHLAIENFVLIRTLEIDGFTGMTALTGETGAGKSILIDALGLVLGARAETRFIKQGCEEATITAQFDITQLSQVNDWLSANDFQGDQECILRRVITSQGRSRCYLNDKPCTLNALQTVGTMLVQIQGQFAQHQLLQREEQRRLLDNYGQHHIQLKKVHEAYLSWQTLTKQKTELELQLKDHEQRYGYLQYQLEEIEHLNLQADELDKLHQQQKQLANAHETIELANQAYEMLQQQAIASLHQTKHILNQLHELSGRQDNLSDLVETASINLQEAIAELKIYQTVVVVDPEQLAMIENRLEKIYEIARKHRIEPKMLSELQNKLSLELQMLKEQQAVYNQIDVQIDANFKAYLQEAEGLSKMRQESARRLSELVTQNIKKLGMQQSMLKIAVHADVNKTCQQYGIDNIEFYFRANAGTEFDLLTKIVSGGELSRISLALQVVTAKDHVIPTLIFDEVDIGIGGAIAECMGQMLRELAKSAQVICITHLAQVAAQAQHHLKVAKVMQNKQTTTQIKELSKMERVEEIARMIGGVTMTAQTFSHAKEILDSTES